MAVAVIQELVTKFGFLGSTRPLTEYNVSLGGSLKLLGGMFVALEAAAAGFAMWSDGVLTGVDALGQLSRETRVSVASIQELNYVAGQTQSSAAAMESSIRGLNKAIGTAALKGSDDFARLGISVRDASGQVKRADVVLDEVRQRFRALNLSMAEQETFTSALGIDSSLLQLLNRTDAEMAGLRDRARELGTLTGDQVMQAEDYKRSMESMWFSMNNVKQLIAVGMAPEMGRLADGFAQLLADNRDWIINGVQAAVRIIGDLLAAFHRLLPVLGIVTAGFLAAKVAALGFTGIMAIIASPVVLVTAAVVALLLIVDDLIVAFQGGESVIASFFKDAFNIDIVKELTDAFARLMTTGVHLWDALSSLFSGLGKLFSGNFSEGLDDLWSAIVSFSKAFYTLFDPVFAYIRNLLANLLPGWALNLLGIDAPAVPAPADPVAATGGAGMTAPTTIPIDTAGRTAGTQIDNRSVSQSVDITVMSPDPQSAGKAVQDNLQRQLDNARAQLATGGR
jgi:hypothetical protein